MKTKVLCLVFALLLLCPLCLTSCSEDTGTVEDASERESLYITLYAITDEKTTEEGIQRTQDALNEYFVDRYKTHLVLRMYPKDQYEAALTEMYTAFEEQAKAAEEQEKADAEAERLRAAEEKNMTEAELRAREEADRAAAQAAEEAKAKEEEERLAAIAAGEEEALAPIDGPQMDILYIDGAEDYYRYIGEEKLLPLDDYLKIDYKILNDYLHQNLLTAAKVSGTEDDAATYGIPNNTAVAETGWYYVFDTELANRYGFDLTVSPPQMSVYSEYINAIRAADPSIIPIANPGPVSGLDFYGNMDGFPISVVNSEYGYFEARGVAQTYSESTTVVQAHFRYMAEFRAAGYFADREMTPSDRFFLDIREGTEADCELWKSQGYTVITYRRPTVDSTKALSGLFGISTYCEYPERAMEVISALTINESLHNTFAFGVLGTNYSVDEKGETVTMLRDDYTMDFDRSGNKLLGYLPAGYSADYKDFIRKQNQASKLSGFSSFYLSLDEDEQAWYDQIAALQAECEAQYATMCKGVSDYASRCAALQRKLDSVDLEGFIADVFAAKYKAAAKEIRSADKANYTTEKEYYLVDPAETATSVTAPEVPVSAN